MSRLRSPIVNSFAGHDADSLLAGMLRQAVRAEIAAVHTELGRIRAELAADRRRWIARGNGEEPLTVSTKRAAQMLDCSRSKLLNLIAAGELESHHQGRYRMVLTSSIRTHLAKLLAAPSKRPAPKPERDRGGVMIDSVEDLAGQRTEGGRVS